MTTVATAPAATMTAIPTPPALMDPPALRFVEVMTFVVGLAVMGKATWDVWRCKRLTYSFLFLWNSLLCYWMETIGDWGQHLIYSPRFWTHHLLDWLPYKTPNDPVFIPTSYAMYWTAHSVMLMYLAPILQRHFKSLSIFQAVVIISLPLNYAWDIAVEGLCTYLGYWTYDPGFGPVIQWPNGGRQPLTWPILLMSVWPNLVAYWAGKPPLTKLNIMEKWFHLDKWTEPSRVDRLSNEPCDETSALLPNNPVQLDLSPSEAYDAKLEYRVRKDVPRWKFELWRFIAWFVCFQVSFFVNFIIPLVGLRIITGKDSIYVP